MALDSSHEIADLHFVVNAIQAKILQSLDLDFEFMVLVHESLNFGGHEEGNYIKRLG